MKPESTKAKIFAILYIVIAISLIVLAQIKPFVVDEFNVYWLMTGGSLLLGLLLLLGKVGAQTAIYLSRIIVGSLFVVSGLIKANDTLGFSYKLEEYFEPNALGSMANFWTYFYDYSLLISIIVSVVEVVLGLFILFGVYTRLVTLKLLLMTIFFGWLTYFTASCNDAQMLAMKEGKEFTQMCVTDCGCFGDALRGSIGRSLTPWESFYKDATLFFYVLLMFAFSSKIKLNTTKDDIIILPASLVGIAAFSGGLFGWMFPAYFAAVLMVAHLLVTRIAKKELMKNTIIISISLITTLVFSIYTLNFLPIKDFRPYAVGKNLVEQMKSAEELGLEAPKHAILYTFKNLKTQKDTIVHSSDYLDYKLYSDEHFKNTYENVSYDGPSIKISDGYEPPISEGEMEFTDLEIFQKVLHSENYVILVVAWNLNKTNTSAFIKLNEIHQIALKKGAEMYGVTNTVNAIKQFSKQNNINYPITGADDKILKAMVRANPGVMLIKGGTVLNMWSDKGLPSANEFEKILN
ncbi:MAG: DoxX family membrane protein [Bacteroidia bacterium]